MIGQRLLLTGLCVAVLSVVVTSGEAEARGRRRCCNNGGRQNSCQQTNSCGQQMNNCGCNTASNWGTQGGYANGNTMSPTGTMGASPTPMNGAGTQMNGNYSVGKPTYADGAIKPNAPQPAINAPVNNGPIPANSNVPLNRLNSVDQNTSPDVDNEGKAASRIQGTAPTKAPAPAANATP